ncbi:GNAT family N-acetyltransferase [Bosea sp. F3-2]|uniref:GNAT family N-acetyltransferase n=1 Tax=Bosea sp. F3-2 TaxID=2599640 RepID=UPI0011EDE708|nr:GNAT family N-acetyltransferase [Bosea sp. F3-2]QEL25654.1 GNAT family N-acetyltransferase [Bosea sp. F3-2]
MSAPPDELELRVVTDKTELCRIMLASWGSHSMMIDLHVYDVAEIDALGLFEPSGATAALASWTVKDDTAYLCALHSLRPGEGVAIQMLDAVIATAKAAGAKRLKAMLTNDNMPGLTFYQRRGFRLSGLYLEAIDAYRSVVPTIIKTGYRDIPIHDALELEIAL